MASRPLERPRPAERPLGRRPPGGPRDPALVAGPLLGAQAGAALALLTVGGRLFLPLLGAVLGALAGLPALRLAGLARKAVLRWEIRRQLRRAPGAR